MGALDVIKNTWTRFLNWWYRMSIIYREDRKGWIICACVLVITVIRSGITYSFGIFIVQLKKTFNTPMAEQNWIGTLSFCISLSCAPVTVALIRTLKHRGYRWGGIIGTLVLSLSCLGSSFITKIEWLFLTHSLMYGMGSSLLYMASSLVIGEYFDKEHKYHVLATSILLCGYPIGSLIFNPINAYLVEEFEWRVAFRVSSGLIIMCGLVCSWQFASKADVRMERLQEESEPESAQEDPDPDPYVDEAVAVDEAHVPRRCCTLQDVKDRPEIVLWYIGNCLSYLGFYMPFINLAFYMDLKHIPPTKASWALTLLSLAECITYIMASFLGDYLKGRLVYINILASSALALICLFWPILDVNYSLILVIAIAMGGFLGLTIVYTYAASGEVTELPIDVAWSCTNLWSGAGILVGPFFSGFIYDMRKSYDDVFYVVGVLYIIDTFVFAAIVLLKHRREGKLKSNFNAFTGIIGNKQTFHISTKRSASKTSLANEEVEGVREYGSTATSTSLNSAKTPPDESNHTDNNMAQYNHRRAVKTWQ